MSGSAALMQEAVDRARELFIKGLPLVGMVNRRLAWIWICSAAAGMCILDKIEQQDYDVLSTAPEDLESGTRESAAGTLARAGVCRVARLSCDTPVS